MVRETTFIKQFQDLSFVCEMTLHSVILGMLKLTNSAMDQVREGQKSELRLITS